MGHPVRHHGRARGAREARPPFERQRRRDLLLLPHDDPGALCLIDFTQRFDRAATLAERVYKAWFGLDGVYFNRDQVDYVAARTAGVLRRGAVARALHAVVPDA